MNRSFYLDSTSGAAVASRAVMQALAHRGFGTEALCGTIIGAGPERPVGDFLGGLGLEAGGTEADVRIVGAGASGDEGSLRLNVGGVPVSVLGRRLRAGHEPDGEEHERMLRLVDETFDRFRPDVLMTYGKDRLTTEVLRRARQRGIASVFAVHNCLYRDRSPFAHADAVLVPSQFAAEHYRRTFGLECVVLPPLVDFQRARAERTGPGYVTFINPSVEKGVFPFARIADELGRSRPDIPLLVVESRGTEADLAGCGLDLRNLGTVNLMALSLDPRKFWGVTRVCLMPSLKSESQPMTAIEALVNGIPVIASDRGGLPETLGSSGTILPLPDRLTPSTRILPTAEEVAPWVEAVIRLWDDPDFLKEHQRKAFAEARRWDADDLEPRYVEFFQNLRPGPRESEREKGTGSESSRCLSPFPGAARSVPASRSSSQTLVLGIGTGRCGSHTLARLLNNQPGARVTHEQPPLLAWTPGPGSPGIRERLERFRNTRNQPLIGDVASFYLPYLEEAIEAEPEIRILCLERPREQVVASFCRWLDTVHPLPTNHWARVPSAGWHHEPVWTRIFPQYDTQDREEGIRLYWDEYHRRVEDLAARFPRNLRVFPMDEVLNIEAAQRAMLSFAGVPEERQMVEVGSRAGAVEQVRTHPRRAVAASTNPRDPRRCVILVPYGTQIVPACELSLRELERRGYAVRRVRGYSAIDQARNQMATDALRDGFEETLWIDSDIGFEADSVDRLRSHNEAVVCGLYPQKGRRALACHVLPGTEKLVFGASGGLVEVLYAGTGFLLVRRRVYMDVQSRLDLPMCNERFDRPLIPFFQPMVRPRDDGQWYLAEDYAFCERARQCGYRVWADTTVRLWHVGQYSYSWEDAGTDRQRYQTFAFHMDPGPDP